MAQGPEVLPTLEEASITLERQSQGLPCSAVLWKREVRAVTSLARMGVSKEMLCPSLCLSDYLSTEPQEIGISPGTGCVHTSRVSVRSGPLGKTEEWGFSTWLGSVHLAWCCRVKSPALGGLLGMSPQDWRQLESCGHCAL